GIGDRNPFWLDHRIAPPTILFAMDRIVSGYVGGLPGIHAMYGGTDFRWRLPIREGDRIVGDSVLLDLVEKSSTFARRALQEASRKRSKTQGGRGRVGADSWGSGRGRHTARGRGNYKATARAKHNAEDIARTRRSYADEEIRGETPRYWNDVQAGESISP